MRHDHTVDGPTLDLEEPPPPNPHHRSITPRERLPSSRSLAGALLITIAFVGAFAVATSDAGGAGTEYLVLVNDIEPGESIGLDDVAPVELTLTSGVESSVLRSTQGLEGATALRLLRAGSLLDRRDLNGAAFVNGEPVNGVHELTLPVDRSRAPDSLQRGDRVTLLAYNERSEVLRTALEDAVVLSFESQPVGLGSSGEARLTVALPAADLVVEATLRSYNSLTVVLTSRAIDDVYSARIGPDGNEIPT